MSVNIVLSRPQALKSLLWVPIMADTAGTEDYSTNRVAADNDSDASDGSFTAADIDLDDISKRLLSAKFLLTALELHTELIERKCELPRLRDFFSNPGNFETQTRLDTLYCARQTASTLTLDSIDDVSRYSDETGRDGDEKVAVLEFELRKAKETIKELRENVTELASGNEPSLNQGEQSDHDSGVHEEVIKPFEARTLNFIVNEYLLKSEYKVTSVTFADEVSNQDLDDWDDVGVNTARPPGLLNLFRDYCKHVIDPKLKGEDEIKELREEIVCLNTTIEKLKADLRISEQENKQFIEEIASLKKMQEDWKEEELVSKPATQQSPQVGNHICFKDKTAEVSGKDLGETTQSPDAVPDIVVSTASEEGSAADLRTIDDSIPLDETESSESFVPLEYEIDETGYQAVVDDIQQEGDQRSFEGSLEDSPELGRSDEDEEKMKGEELNTEEAEGSKLKQEPTSPSKKSGVSQSFLDALLKQIYTQGDSRLMKEVQMAIDDDGTVIHVLARSLPNIIPNVLLNKRDELIPIILCAVRLHPDMKTRDELLHMLFNLIKRPDEEQRKIIIGGFVAYARSAGATRIEAELLPQCWEQITHRYPERRLLVAETCGFLAPFLPVELQSSLIFSMLRQMLQDDYYTQVRQAAVKSLALNLAFTREPGKYTQAYDLLAQILCDKEEEVASSAKHLLLPVLGVWASDIGKLQSHLFSNLLNNLKNILQTVFTLSKAEEEETTAQTLKDLQHQFKLHVECLVNLVTNLFCFVLETAPFVDDDVISVSLNESRIPPLKNELTSPKLIIGNEDKFNFLVHTFDNEISTEEHNTWESLDWVCNNCISMICELTGYSSAGSGSFVGQLVCFMCVLCRIFGKPFTYRKIIPYFEKLMRSTVLFFLGDTPPLCSGLLPVFACGVLSVFDTDDGFRGLFSFLKQSLLTISMQDLPLDSLLFCVQFLCSNDKHQAGLVEMLRETLVYPSVQVRRATAVLFEMLVRHASPAVFTTQVAPAIITLSNDQDISVRTETVPALATVVEMRTDHSILEKVFLQFQSLIDEPGLMENIQLEKAIVKSFPRIIPNAEERFREEFLIQRLRKLTEANSFHPEVSDQVEVAGGLIQAYSCLLCCHIKKEVISSDVIPALRFLERDVKELVPDFQDTVTSLLVDAQTKCQDDDRLSTGSGSLGGHRGEVKNKLLSGLSRLKDASHRPKDIFKKKE